jgi:signal transduction histidine kinase
MDKTKAELNAELIELKQKYLALDAKHNEEISGFKKDEEELRLKIMFLEGIANSAIDGFLVVNPHGQKILQNQQTINLWKIPREVADEPSDMKQVDHVMHMTVNPQQFLAEVDYLREHPNDKSRDEVELIDGTVLDRYSSAVIGSDGVNYGRIWTFHEVTERKNFEKQLIQLNTDKDRFISILAHDLRSPFNSLLGITDLLKTELRSYPIEKIEEMVEMIYNVVARTYELLEDTLLWASIQSKKITFNPSIANMNEVMSEVVKIFEPNTNAKKISIRYTSDNGLYIKTDVYMLKAILRNLISNAIKFTKVGGKIEISAVHTNSLSTINVSDNGVGIEQGLLEKLFSFTPNKSRKGTTEETGTGLGLLLCKEFVDKHGGKIWADSIVGKGTTVSFSIPDRE